MTRSMISIAIALGVWLGVAATAHAGPPCATFCTCDLPCNSLCTLSPGHNTTCGNAGKPCQQHCAKGANPLACAAAANRPADASAPMCRPGGDDDAPVSAAPVSPKRRV